MDKDSVSVFEIHNSIYNYIVNWRDVGYEKVDVSFLTPPNISCDLLWQEGIVPNQIYLYKRWQ